MNTNSPDAATGRVASLHQHPPQPGAPLQSVDSIEVIAEQGIAGEPRYFGRVNQTTGKPSRRQITLIEREQISGHAAALGLKTIPPGAVRANVETLGVSLAAYVGQQIEIGNALLSIYEMRSPCRKMCAVCTGLRALMENQRQGVLAEVIRSGRICVNDPIRPAKPSVADPVRSRVP